MANGIRASIDLIAYPWTPSRDEATIRREFEHLVSLGINAFEAGWGHLGIGTWRDGDGIEVVIDRIYNLAAEYGIKVYWYTSIHRLPWINPDTGETFVGRYKNFPACAGWSYADEPALKNYDHDGCKAAKDWINSEDPNHPVNPVFSADLETARYMFTMHPAWGDLYDVSCTDIYPHARASGGDDWKGFLAYRSQLTYHYTGKAPYWGFEHWQPRNHIAVIQAFEAGSRVDIVGQYNILKNGGVGGGLTFAGWGDRLKGIAFYQAPLFASGAFADMIRGQIKDLARLLGWRERAEVITTPPIEEPVTPPVEEPEVITPPVEKPVGPATEHQITCPQCRSVSTVFECLITEPGAYCPISEFPLQDCPICGYKIVERAKKIEVIEAKPWPPIEEADSLSQLDDITTPTGSPVQESEMKRQAMIMQLEPIPIMAPIEIPITEKPLILAEVEPLKEKILSLDWLKNNWPWVGVGLVGLTLIITLAKD